MVDSDEPRNLGGRCLIPVEVLGCGEGDRTGVRALLAVPVGTSWRVTEVARTAETGVLALVSMSISGRI